MFRYGGYCLKERIMELERLVRPNLFSITELNRLRNVTRSCRGHRKTMNTFLNSYILYYKRSEVNVFFFAVSFSKNESLQRFIRKFPYICFRIK